MTTFSPNANGVGADAGQPSIARTPMAWRLNVSRQAECLSRGEIAVESIGTILTIVTGSVPSFSGTRQSRSYVSSGRTG